MFNSTANKAVVGAGSVPLVYVVAKTLLWKWPHLDTLLTEEYLMMFQAAVTGLVVWLVPNKKETTE